MRRRIRNGGGDEGPTRRTRPQGEPTFTTSVINILAQKNDDGGVDILETCLVGKWRACQISRPGPHLGPDDMKTESPNLHVSMSIWFPNPEDGAPRGPLAPRG